MFYCNSQPRTEKVRSTNERASLVHKYEEGDRAVLLPRSGQLEPGASSSPSPYHPRRPERSSYNNSPKESSPGIKGPSSSFPLFLRTSTSRSRSQSLIKSMSNSPTTTTSNSEFGESKREKDKSHKRKSHLNRAFTEEPVPPQQQEQPDTTNTTSSSSAAVSPFPIHSLSPPARNAFNHEHQMRLSVDSSNANSGCEDLSLLSTTGRGIQNAINDADNNDDDQLRTNQSSGNRKSTASIYKVPTIPSILTTTVTSTENSGDSTSLLLMNTNPITNYNGSSMNNSSRSISPSPSPSMKQKLSSKGSTKMQSLIQQESPHRKSSPVVKKDSFSDAEGVSFIKKLLQKESLLEKAPTTSNMISTVSSSSGSSDLLKGKQQQPTSKESSSSLSSGFSLKKSSSVGSNSYWSKFSNSQPAFLKKFFDKQEKPTTMMVKAGEVGESETTKSFRKEEKQEVEQQNQKMVQVGGPSPSSGGDLLMSSNSQVPSSSSTNLEDLETEPTEPVLGFSVAQKASFFMKLEHEQRFSKWRKNSLAETSTTTTPTLPCTNMQQQMQQFQLTSSSSSSYDETQMKSATTSHESHKSNNRSSRQLTQPVTFSEVQQAANILISSNKNAGGNVPLDTSQPPVPPARSSNKSRTPVSNGMNTSLQFEDTNFESQNQQQQLGGFENFGYEGVSTLNNEDDHLRTVDMKLKPFKLSMKERVNMFDKLITPAPNGKVSSSLSATTTPYPVSSSSLSGGMHGKSYPMNHSSSGVISSSTPVLQDFYTPDTMNQDEHRQQQESISTLYGNHGPPYDGTMNPNSHGHPYAVDSRIRGLPYSCNAAATTFAGELDQSLSRRRGSTSDLELSSTPKYSPVTTKRNSKSRSMFVSDDGSEDGEVSSGGQEVSEIISRSYENSPIARKKSWKVHQQQQKQSQANFTKEIWRRCKVNDNWSWKWNGGNNGSQESPKKSKPTTYKVTTNVSHQVVSSSCVLPNQAMLSHNHPQIPPQPPSYHHHHHPQMQQQNTAATISNHTNSNSVSSSETTTPPATSNLLQILTVLSSSNDELSESHSKSSSSLSKPATINLAGKFTHNNSNVVTPPDMSHQQHHVTVPHPDDESFQTFFSSRTTSSTHSNVNTAYLGASSSSHEPEMDVVQRESGMLVMRKNLPIVRRKSVGKSRNPLKALAARIDFHNQWYTDSGSGETNNGTEGGNPSMF